MLNDTENTVDEYSLNRIYGSQGSSMGNCSCLEYEEGNTNDHDVRHELGIAMGLLKSFTCTFDFNLIGLEMCAHLS